MMSSNNPYRKGDKVSIERGQSRLAGTVLKTVLARVHILIDGKVFVEDWHDCKRRRDLTQQR